MSSRQSTERSIYVSDESASRLSTASTAFTLDSSAGLIEGPTSSPLIRLETGTEIGAATLSSIKAATSTKSTTPAGDGMGLSTADKFGIAGVGIFVAGALIFWFAALWFQKKRRHLDVAQPAPVAEMQPDVSRKVSRETLSPTAGVAGVPNRSLVLGVSDSDVRRELSSLGLLIEHHVEGHYHQNDISATQGTLHESLNRLHLTEATRHMVVRLSVDPNTRYNAIRHLLALVIFSNLETHSVRLLSLKEMSRSRARVSRQKKDSFVDTTFVSRNRIMAFLMHEKPQTGTPLLPPPGVETQLDTLITPLQEFLVHFVRIDDHHSIDDQEAGLTGVIRQCVKFGCDIFSHPCDWEFTFPKQEKGIVVLPGLTQHSRNMGELCNPSRIILTPKILAVKPTKN